jgi:hypothetical protein
MIKLKTEASGWDDSILCPEEPEKEDELKLNYIRSYMSRYGIELDIDRITKNEGLKFIAKLMINSFWG